MDLGLRDRVACVAAASSGLGRGVALALAREGASVVLCSRDEGRARDAAASIASETGASVMGVAADVTTAAGVERFIGAAIDTHSRLDILVTNAGGPPSGTFDTTDDDAWERAFHLTLMSAVRLARIALPHMTARKWGRILNITSISAKQPVDGLLLSNAMRAAVTGMAKTLSREVAPHGVTVNTILPGYTGTERLVDLASVIADREGLSRDDVYARWASETPIGRIATVEEFAAVAAFLVSAPASYITGAAIPVDGGWIRSLL